MLHLIAAMKGPDSWTNSSFRKECINTMVPSFMLLWVVLQFRRLNTGGFFVKVCLGLSWLLQL